jgi:catechol 2,3-dioxygenase-like lactoylglutathione lyase family enzyme
MIDHVNAVVLPVRDVAKCTAFYRDKLGFKLNHKDEESAFLAIGGKGAQRPKQRKSLRFNRARFDLLGLRAPIPIFYRNLLFGLSQGFD